MKFFYYCNQQVFLAIVVAYIHLQKLPKDRTPSINEILMISEYERLISGDDGVPYFIGDKLNSQVYVINFNSNISLALQTVKNVLSQRGVDFSKWCFKSIVESAELNHICIRIGERLSRNCFARSLGKYLIAIGIQKKYWRIWEMVNSSKEEESGG